MIPIPHVVQGEWLGFKKVQVTIKTSPMYPNQLIQR